MAGDGKPDVGARGHTEISAADHRPGRAICGAVASEGASLAYQTYPHRRRGRGTTDRARRPTGFCAPLKSELLFGRQQHEHILRVRIHRVAKHETKFRARARVLHRQHSHADVDIPGNRSIAVPGTGRRFRQCWCLPPELYRCRWNSVSSRAQPDCLRRGSPIRKAETARSPFGN